MRVQIGKTIEMDVALERLGLPTELSPAASHVVYIGLRNVLMDSHASVTKDEPDHIERSREMAEKKLDALYRGEVRVAQTRAPHAADALAAEIKRLATGIVMRTRGNGLAKLKKRERVAALREMAAAYATEHNAELRPIAERRVRELAALTGEQPVAQPQPKPTKKAKGLFRAGAAA
jgi:hypothetical protein